MIEGAGHYPHAELPQKDELCGAFNTLLTLRLAGIGGGVPVIAATVPAKPAEASPYRVGWSVLQLPSELPAASAVRAMVTLTNDSPIEWASTPGRRPIVQLDYRWVVGLA